MVQAQSINMPAFIGVTENIYWSIDYIFSFRALSERLANSFSQAIRGVDEYFNPFEERPVELPGGYGQAWANSLGEYIVSDDPNFNPNIGSNLNWQPLQRRG